MRIRSVVVYSVLRLLAFLVPFGVMMIFPVFQDLWWLAAIFAALIGLSLSILLLRRPLDDVSTSLYTRSQEKQEQRKTGRELDAEAEDAAVDDER
ncbi:DUF4229 domain-containing protein [Microbacterium betulae]|uniref:DUF4229 domain-containing protein n=1 Tax=Microbacterium betulae TaxID=2981139 RepID=A0AA97FJ40_9MICO|nr:DUF4229 domain-containing protein [Microbacterium sp. AB]WOF23614.1 DUF4229 domain-containing protein [Microbacterium sp. AB]